MTVIIAGLSVGAIYAMIAIGYNITYLAAGVINFAFANFVMLGAFTWLVVTGFSIPALIGMIIMLIVFAVLGIVEERVAIRSIPKGKHAELITTMGVATLLTGVMAVIWGSEPRPVPPLVSGRFQLGDGIVVWNSVLLIVAALVVALVLSLVLKYTRFGLAALALNEDRTAAILRGVDANKLAIIAFAVSIAYAALVSPLVGAFTFAVAGGPLVLAIKGFFAMTIGGAGSNWGAVIGGFSVGLIEQIAARFAGAGLQNLFVFAAFLVFVLIRPTGIFAKRKLRSI